MVYILSLLILECKLCPLHSGLLPVAWKEESLCSIKPTLIWSVNWTKKSFTVKSAIAFHNPARFNILTHTVSHPNSLSSKGLCSPWICPLMICKPDSHLHNCQTMPLSQLLLIPSFYKCTLLQTSGKKKPAKNTEPIIESPAVLSIISHWFTGWSHDQSTCCTVC